MSFEFWRLLERAKDRAKYFWRSPLGKVAVIGGAAYGLSKYVKEYDPRWYRNTFGNNGRANTEISPIGDEIPTRQQQLTKLKSGDNIYDILVIGGGATGAGIALDATTRGYKVALVESDDFASGTSSRSTKLIHGGVRYLERAVMHLDKQAFVLVWDALRERKTFMRVAPHLTNPLPIMTPCYKLWELPYYWAGLKAYDLLAGSSSLHSSYFLSRSKSLREFPLLAKEGLKGTVVYFDGQMDDARVNVSIALTAAGYGATVANYCSVQQLLKENGLAKGAIVRDEFTGETFPIHSKVVINATGAFAGILYIFM